ncbi:MAG TPA: tetratricopeptide repeat protein, partial [Chloroflexota bacterium]|nr:tetratricopeptide repeat protein [Chloroflexota bacterium]
MRSHLTEGRRWLDEALRQAADAPEDMRADALCNSGVLALAQGDYGAAGSLLETALRIAREINDLTRIARTQNYLAVGRQEEGQYELAVGLHEDTLALWRCLGNALG